jgi:hypothetical protein
MAFTSRVQSRETVTSTPYAAGFVHTTQDAVVGAGQSLSATFDVVTLIVDPSQIEAVIQNGVIVAVGPLVDAFLFSDQNATLDVLVCAETGALFRSILSAPFAYVGAAQPLLIAGLRVPTRYIRVTYTNPSANNASTDFSVYARTN